MWWRRVFTQPSDSGTDVCQREEAVIVKNTFIDVDDKSEVKHALRRSASDSELSTSSISSRSHGVSEAAGLDAGEMNFVCAQSNSSGSINAAEWNSARGEPTVLNGQLRETKIVDSHGLVPDTTSQSGGAVREQVDQELWSISQDLKISIAEIQEFGDLELLKSIPRGKTGELTSVGSLQHAEDNCRPCLFWYRNSCTKGLRCDFCHMKHKGQKTKRLRPGKTVRQLMRTKAEVQDGFESDEDKIYNAVVSSIRSKSEQESSCGSSEG